MCHRVHYLATTLRDIFFMLVLQVESVQKNSVSNEFPLRITYCITNQNCHQSIFTLAKPLLLYFNDYLQYFNFNFNGMLTLHVFLAI